MNILEKFSLKGKVALITGGGGKYGRQMVLALAQAGAITCTASRNVDALKDFCDQVHQKEGLTIHPYGYDQSDPRSIEQLKEKILQDHGCVDILVNNSVARSGHVEDLTFEDLEQDLSVNGSGLIWMLKVFCEQMKKQQKGSIINIGSIYGLVGYDDWLYRGTGLQKTGGAAYYFNKGGMVNLTRFFAGYYGEYGVRVNCIHPGGYQTPETPKDFMANYIEKTFLKRMANDEDVQGILVFLASDASAYMTGTNIPVDGGLSAK